jgi:hypothetical protein
MQNLAVNLVLIGGTIKLSGHSGPTYQWWRLKSERVSDQFRANT